VVLGSHLDPINPLYGGAVAAAETHAPTETQVLYGAGAAAAAAAALEIARDTREQPVAYTGLDFDLGLDTPAEGGAQPGIAPATGPVAAADVTADLGFDLDLDGYEKKAAAAVGDTQTLDAKAPGAPDPAAPIDFDFELPAVDEAAHTTQAKATVAAPAASAEDSGGIDFDFDLDLPAHKVEAPAAPLDLSLISLDLGSPGGAAAPTDAHWQEIATKLDLAKAYHEMGDKDGSRELLSEVLKEGDAAQQQQAKAMLSALG
jgi:pilus assembly protein FimV